jgi:hypothetical protein
VHTSASTLPSLASAPVERRRSRRRRVKTAQRIRIRPVQFTATGYEDVQTRENVSRNGVYFLTHRSDYRVDAMVYVTCPYSAQASTHGVDYIAKVVRVEPKPSDRFGIALEFREPTKFKTHKASREQHGMLT